MGEKLREIERLIRESCRERIGKRKVTKLLMGNSSPLGPQSFLVNLSFLLFFIFWG